MKKKEGIIFAVTNSNGDFLNIRKFSADNLPLWNSVKEKKFWFTQEKACAFAQSFLLNKMGENTRVVKIIEIDGDQNDQPNLPFSEHVKLCKVRGYIARKTKPEEKFWKDNLTPLADRVPDEDQSAEDWEHYDPEAEEASVVA